MKIILNWTILGFWNPDDVEIEVKGLTENYKGNDLEIFKNKRKIVNVLILLAILSIILYIESVLNFHRNPVPS